MIKVNNISVQFDNKQILKDFSYTFEDNVIYTITGKSGCGKTTLLRSICGLLEPNSGEVLFNDKKIKKPIKEIFMMHQHYSNFPWKTCLENIMFPLTIHGKITNEQIEEGKQILSLVGLGEYEFKFPSELSGGMNQRLALARLILAKPKVMLMDEPMSALDSETRSRMQNILLNLHKITKNTIIMITHSEEEATKMGDKILRF